jgi:hypothetical protein
LSRQKLKHAVAQKEHADIFGQRGRRQCIQPFRPDALPCGAEEKQKPHVSSELHHSDRRLAPPVPARPDRSTKTRLQISPASQAASVASVTPRRSRRHADMQFNALLFV